MQFRARFNSYLAVARISFRNARQYTVDFLTNFVYFPAELIALFFVYSTVYWQVWVLDGTTTIGGFTLLQLISYLFITLTIQRTLPQYRMSRDIERDIDQGQLIAYLSKPMGYAGYRFFREFPRSLIYLFFGALTYLAGMLLFNLSTPNPFNLLLFIPLYLGAYIITFLLIYTMSLATFWTGRQWWLRNLVTLVTLIAGGGLVPLTFFPTAIQQILTLLPFQYCYFIPVAVLQGFYNPFQLTLIILIDAAWLVILYVMMRLVWRRGRHRYEGAGG